MKKNFLILIVSVFILSACSSNKNDVDPTAPMDISVEGSVDVNALNSLAGNDATALVTINGQSAATFTTESIPGDKIDYKINASSSNTEIRIINFRFNLAASTASFDDWEINFIPVVDTISNPAKAYINVDARAVAGDEYKFDIDFKVYTNGVSDGKIYYADPKIRIKSSRVN